MYILLLFYCFILFLFDCFVLGFFPSFTGFGFILFLLVMCFAFRPRTTRLLLLFVVFWGVWGFFFFFFVVVLVGVLNSNFPLPCLSAPFLDSHIQFDGSVL